MNRTQLSLALDRMDRLYPNVLQPDYRDEVLGVGRSFAPLSRTAKKLAALLHAQRGRKLEQLEEPVVAEVRRLHDELREGAQRLLAAKVWIGDE
ncbi:hypothetical protein [Niveispirillum sp. KHB5.9]|uniref:hypothetical protein n=1 Tax=Niveispirillum sp. KHB5.9 TaxID=3400269 RepID=UPI003A858FCB